MNIEDLRAICSKFPKVTEDVKWENNLCFCIAGKIFCIANLDPPHTFSFKVTEEEFDELSESPGFQPAPYLAKAKWVLCADPATISKAELKKHLQQSYELIKAKIPRLQLRKLGLD